MTEHEGEAFYKKQLEIAARERKLLQERLEALEKENRDLRRSVFELSLRRSASETGVFDLTSALNDTSPNPSKGVHVPEASRFVADFQVLSERTEAGLGAAESIPGSRAASPAASLPVVVRRSGERQSSSSLSCRSQLIGHKGAVYALSWSSCGSYLASGSFDRSVRVWSVDQSPRCAVAVADAHAANVVDLCWTQDNRYLHSAGFDHCIRVWDWSAFATEGNGSDARRQAVQSWSLPRGLVLCLAIDPDDAHCIYAGTSNGFVYRLDRRVQQMSQVTGSRPSSPAAGVSARPEQTMSRVLTSASGIGMVNSMVFLEHDILMIGDSQGLLHTFDLRRPETALSCQLNDEAASPVAHIQRSPSGRYVAVNAFDDCLRMYEVKALRTHQENTNTNDVQLVLYQTHRGHRLGRLPLRCSLYERGFASDRGASIVDAAALAAPASTKASSGMPALYAADADVSGAAAAVVHESRTLLAAASDVPIDGSGQPPASQQRSQQLDGVLNASSVAFGLVAATGSTNGRIFLYDSQSSAQEAVKTIDAHSDRVYCVAFHPHSMMLASCSADGSIKLWD